MKTIAETLRQDAEEKGATFGVYIGRLCPMHLGHQALVEGLLEVFPQNHAVFIGSCNRPISIRNLFSYGDRSDFVKAVFPRVRIAPLPDFETDESWFRALDDLIYILGAEPKNVIFIGGSKEDVDFFYNNGRTVHIVNRYTGPTKKVSGSEIRDAMIEKHSLDGLLDPKVISLVTERFPTRWSELRSR
jgi:nicotinic acid mononucleotide adenylyltransferase